MIKFEFTLADADAENLICILRDEVLRIKERALDAAGGHTDWYNAHTEYLETMINTILAGNKRVD